MDRQAYTDRSTKCQTGWDERAGSSPRPAQPLLTRPTDWVSISSSQRAPTQVNRFQPGRNTLDVAKNSLPSKNHRNAGFAASASSQPSPAEARWGLDRGKESKSVQEPWSKDAGRFQYDEGNGQSNSAKIVLVPFGSRPPRRLSLFQLRTIPNTCLLPRLAGAKHPRILRHLRLHVSCASGAQRGSCQLMCARFSRFDP